MTHRIGPDPEDRVPWAFDPDCACVRCRYELWEKRLRYAVRGPDDRAPDALSRMDAIIAQSRGEVSAEPPGVHEPDFEGPSR